MARTIEEIESDINRQEKIKKRLVDFPATTVSGQTAKETGLNNIETVLKELKEEKDGVLSTAECATISRILSGEQSEEERRAENSEEANQEEFIRLLQAKGSQYNSGQLLIKIEHAFRRYGGDDWFKKITEKDIGESYFRGIGPKGKKVVREVLKEMKDKKQ
jgi:hypothetical protein